MTEAEWLLGFVAEDAEEARAAMLGVALRRGGARKQRLFAVSCCRRVWGLMRRSCHRGVEIAERYADGEATRKELNNALRWASSRAAARSLIRPAMGHAARAAAHAASWEIGESFAAAADAALRARLIDKGSFAGDVRAQCRDLLDIFGNPFRPARTHEDWLRWNDGCLVRMARGIYGERRFHDLPILHDALLDAGCDDEEMLAHCREPAGHVRGCWVLDLLLGRD